MSGIVSKENSVAADTGSRSLCGSIERPKSRMSKAKLKMKILALERTLQATCEEKERCKELLEQREAGGSSPGATDVAEQLEEKARLEEQVGALERDLVSLKESDENQIEELHEQVTELQMELQEKELQLFQSVEAERLKWEVREARWLKEMMELERKLGSGSTPRRDDRTASVSATDSEETSTSGTTETGSEGPIFPAHDAQQLPVLPPFRGEEGAEKDSFEDWVDRLEEMATWCAWDDNKKLTQLRLEGAARSFYKFCSEAERKSYDALKAALAKRFTPV